MQHQGQLSQRKKVQAANAAARANAVAQHQAEQARKQAERGRAQLAKASVAEQKEAEKEAQRLHEDALLAEAAAKNAQLADTDEEINSILSSTLAVDGVVDLERLRAVAQHPPFTRTDLEVPGPQPVPLAAREEPLFVEPAAPTGLGGVFGRKKHAELVAQAHGTFVQDHAMWEAEVAALPAAQLRQMQEYREAEQRRFAWLEQARQQYQSECNEREAAVAQTNVTLDELIRGLNDGVQEAVQEYVGIILSNSVYPDSFPVEHEFTFDSLKELSLTAMVPPPSTLRPEKQFKYTRASRQVGSTLLSQKELRDRYSDALHQVALRTFHEVFTADRAAQIQTIALTVATETIDVSTGLRRRIVLMAVAAERTHFQSFDLTNVVPAATLRHLGALVSKNPLDLVEVDLSKGVRAR